MQATADQNAGSFSQAGASPAELAPRPTHRASTRQERAPWSKPVVEVVEPGLEVTAYERRTDGGQICRCGRHARPDAWQRGRGRRPAMELLLPVLQRSTSRDRRYPATHTGLSCGGAWRCIGNRQLLAGHPKFRS